jgi:hypothetical protein
MKPPTTQEMLKAWERLQQKIEEELLNSAHSGELANIHVYEYLLTSIIPAEIEFWKENKE